MSQFWVYICLPVLPLGQSLNCVDYKVSIEVIAWHQRKIKHTWGGFRWDLDASQMHHRPFVTWFITCYCSKILLLYACLTYHGSTMSLRCVASVSEIQPWCYRMVCYFVAVICINNIFFQKSRGRNQKIYHKAFKKQVSLTTSTIIL